MPAFPGDPMTECSTNGSYLDTSFTSFFLGNPVFGLYEQDETAAVDPAPLAIIPEDERFEAGIDGKTAR